MIRAFLALPLPGTLADRLSLAQRRLPLARPVPRENFHVTLVFLDAQPEPVLEDLHLALEGMRLKAPHLVPEAYASFGGAEPDALHLRLAPDPGLGVLQAKLAQAARGAGIALKARKFVPHVTLARFRHGEMGPGALARALETLGPPPSESWQPEALILYRSTLRPEGPLYDPLARYALTA